MSNIEDTIHSTRFGDMTRWWLASLTGITADIKIRLRSRISDSNLSRLMRTAIEGLELSAVDFNEILDVYKEQNCRIFP